jgi:hypothetical protein
MPRSTLAAAFAVSLFVACVSVHGAEDVPLDAATDARVDDVPVDVGTDAGCDELPALETCDYGLYWADCGGSGPPRAACDLATGACRWFEGGVVPCGHIASDCPLDDLCCEPALDGLGVWPFVSWHPEGAVLAGALSIDGLYGGVITAAAPAGIPVVLDFTVTPPRGVEVTCDEGGGLPECMMRLLVRRRVGQSLVLHFLADDLGVNRRSLLLEAWRATPGLQGRWYLLTAPQRDSPVRAACGRSEAYMLPLAGEVHLSPDAFEHPERVHGVISGSTPDRGAFTIRF